MIGFTQTMSRQTGMKDSLMLLVALCTGSLALVLAAVYTHLFADRLGSVAFVAGLVWMQLLVILFMVIFYLRRVSLRRSATHQAGLFVRAGAVPVTAGCVALSLLWMFFALSRDDYTIPYRVHWLIQLVLLTSFGGLMGWKFITTNGAGGRRDPKSASILATQRRQQLSAIAGFRTSDWLDQTRPDPDLETEAEVLTTSGISVAVRLKAAMRWWEEEMELSLPPQRIMTADPAVRAVIMDMQRQVDFLSELRERGPSTDYELLDAERRVIDSIERLGSLARRMPG